jgi:hypothetical protein
MLLSRTTTYARRRRHFIDGVQIDAALLAVSNALAMGIAGCGSITYQTPSSERVRRGFPKLVEISNRLPVFRQSRHTL